MTNMSRGLVAGISVGALLGAPVLLVSQGSPNRLGRRASSGPARSWPRAVRKNDATRGCQAHAALCVTAGIGNTSRSECVQQLVALSTQEE
jgi:hypothetical protein